MEASEIHSLELTFENTMDEGWEQVYTDWQDGAVEELKAKYGDRIETIFVEAHDALDAEAPAKIFSVQATLEPLNND